MSEQKEKTRNSVLAHLGALKNMGAENIFVGTRHAVPVRKSTTVVSDSPSYTKLQNSGVVTDSSVETRELGTEYRASANTADLKAATSLEALRTHIGDCTRCKLCTGRKNLVFGAGNPNASLMFVGEGPGADEDEQGIPFVGRAGQLLTKIIESMGLKREDVYIANVVKCRPPENRNPEPDEIAACMPFLKQQIAVIKPKVIMCLGKFAAQTVLDTQVTISKLRGTFQDVNGVAVMPAFHPAYLLRNPSMKRIMWEDCKLVMAKLEEL